MSIYRKLAQIQQELMHEKIPKSGFSKYAGGKYWELEDLLPLISEKCYNHELTFLFIFTQDEAILRIRDWDNKNINEISNRVPLPDVIESLKTQSKKMSAPQWEGSMLTYFKRYLLMNTFLLCENEVLDSKISDEIEELTDTVTNPDTKKNKQVAEMETAETIEPAKVTLGEIPAPQIIQEIKDDLAHKNMRATRVNVAKELSKQKPAAEIQKAAKNYLSQFKGEELV